MSHIHFIGGEKGGIGKSLMSRVLAQYFIDCQLPFTGFDSDRSHGALLRFYAGYASPVSVDAHDGLDRVVEAASEHPDQRVLVDLAAQTESKLQRWMEDADVLGITTELQIGITYWHMMDAGRDSVDLLAKWLDRWGGKLGLVVVQNEVRGAEFELLTASGQRERALNLGAQVLTLPHLHDGTMRKIDGHDTSFWAAVQSSERPATGLGLLERQRVKMWLQKIYADLDGLNL
jgi:hypothetical protein